MKTRFADPVDRSRLSDCRFRASACALAAWLALAGAACAYDLSFDYTSFEATFKQAQFNVLNYPRMNGSYMMTSTDNHRPEMVANGNALAEFYNWLTDRYTEQTVKDGAAAADVINQYTVNNSTKNGPRPNWIILNEISPSLWSANAGPPSNSTYRTWLINLVTRLRDHHGYNVITLAPFQEPQQNNASWQALSAVSYIGIECYLSGTEVWNSGSTYEERLAWAEGEYRDSKQAYMNRGVPANRLFVTEHFANNTTHMANGNPINWGRAGLASADAWDQVIMIRQDAILNVGFDGFLAYHWSGNGMGVTEAEQIQHEYYYRTRRVLASQKPQWLPDNTYNVNGTTIPLSWGQQLNWLGGIPNASGAEVNFWRTNTAARTVTLDGSRTVGKLTFESPSAYTISAGSGGLLIFNNVVSHSTLISNQGNHTISANVVNNGLSAAINNGTTFTISGNVSGAGGLIKSGNGLLALTGSANSYTGNTTVQAGTLRISNRFLADGADVLLFTGATLNLTFSGTPDIIDSLFINGIAQAAGIWGAVGSTAEFKTPLITGTGLLQISTGPLVGDYNNDDVVDAADYVMWRAFLGDPTIANRHPNATGDVDFPDFQTWGARLGNDNTGGGGSESGQQVPEPTGLSLSFITALSGLLYWSHAPRRSKRGAI